MLAKRFAVIIMLSQDIPQHEIQGLGMSPVTINLCFTTKMVVIQTF